MRTHIRNLLIFAFLVPSIGFTNEAEFDEEPARIYRNPEERREAGLGRQITDWLQVSGLVEISKEYLEDNSRNGDKFREYDRPVTSLQLGLNFTFTDWLSAEVIFDSEYDFEAKSDENQLTSEWEEAFIEVSLGEWDIQVGRLYVPFGEYYSYFATGPFLEFGETRGDGIVVDYSFNENFEISGFVFDSEVVRQNQDGSIDWGASLEYSSDDESIRGGLGYLSDLGESDERFLSEENDRYEKRVSAWNAYLLVGFEPFEFTAEYVKSNNRFREFDENEDRPEAFNIELAYFPASTLQFALRYEQSKEYADEPKHQYGISSTFAPIDHFTLTIEYLHGKYKRGFVEDDNDSDLEDRDIVAIEASLEF